MRPPLDGSVALVTGASSGIGREFARQLAPRARALVLVARRVDRLEELKKELAGKHPSLAVHLVPCDLADRAATDAALERIAKEVGPVDILINNAGLGDVGVFDLASWSKIQQIIAVDVTALCHLTHRLLPGMLERRRGGILNVSSSAGLHFIPGFGVYAAAKNFVTALTEAVRIEARPAGVVVSQLCPGPVATEFEQVASEVPGLSMPGVFNLSAERCVRWGLSGFSRGKALIVPGWFMNLVMLFGGMTPRWTRRLFFGLFTGKLREHQLAMQAKAGAAPPA